MRDDGYEMPRATFILAMPLRKRVWRLLMLIVKGWCYCD